MEWEADNSKTITFVVTKDCQLACKYCYLVGKNNSERMSWDTAKDAVDFVLSQYGKDNFTSEAVIFDFIGGEPFLEIDLIDRICDYIKRRLYELKHPWFNLYRFSFSTNGINYHTEKVQKFIKKNHKHLSIGFSIDGTKAKHDLNRIWKGNGAEKGSYLDVVSNVPLWLEQFPDGATKVTISSADIPYISESVLHLFSLGIHHVNINCVFEDVWKDGDDVKFKHQLITLASEIVDQGLYPNYECSFFDRNIGKPLSLLKDNNNWCGCGRMMAIDTRGIIHPCIRFLDFALTHKKSREIGSIYSGIDQNKLRPFLTLDRVSQSDLKCLDCNIASGCAWCQGENYDSAKIPSIYIRSTSICKMHIARVQANNYFWDLLDSRNSSSECSGQYESFNEQDTISSNDLIEHLDGDSILTKAHNTYFCKSKINQLTLLLSSNANPICGYNVPLNSHEIIDNKRLRDFFKKYVDFDITIVYPKNGEISPDLIQMLDEYPHRKMLPIDDYYELINEKGNIVSRNLSLKFSDFYSRASHMENNLVGTRLNIYLYDYSGFDLNKYSESLNLLKNQVLNHWHNGHKIRVNLITDPFGLRSISECSYGSQSLFIGPNGKFYLCPAFYYNDVNSAIGTIADGWSINYEHLFHREYSPVCRSCTKKACLRCIFDNVKGTLEYNIPTHEQCLKAEIEGEICLKFFNEL